MTQPSRDKEANRLAVIALCVTVIASLIPAAATLLGTLIVVVSASREKVMECCCVPKDDWQEYARSKGWIPWTECAWESRQAIGHDSKNNQVTVRIHLLSGEYRWVLASSDQAELGGQSVDLPSHIRGLEISPKATAVVAVGMASVEGNFPEQSILAEERTDRLIRLIKDELKPTVPVHGLSLGRFLDERTKSTSRATAAQRRVVVVEVLENNGANLSEAVYDALKQASDDADPIPFDVRNYKDRRYTDHSFDK